MKTKNKIGFLVVVLLLIVVNSCRQIHYYESDAFIISRTIDLSLEDSVLIYGMVYYAADENLIFPFANIWLEENNLKTVSDYTGFFSLKITAGTYTIKCLQENENEEFTAIIEDILVLPNEKIEIKFLHGSRDEF
jgi:hypothetical protein